MAAHLSSASQVTAVFQHVEDQWRRQCGQRKVYVVIGYDGLTLDSSVNDVYTDHVRRTMALIAILAVRYGGDVLQRANARIRAMKLHSPSNLYGTFEEALEVVAGLQAGTIALAP
jgi:hypothetical protein